MSRKVLVVVVSVFLRANVFDQTYCALFIVYGAMALQFKYNPFTKRLHNACEYLSLGTTIITLNGGIMGYGVPLPPLVPRQCAAHAVCSHNNL